VPRKAALGEVVDDHQRAFAARLAADGSVEMVEDEDALRRTLDRALAEPHWLLLDADAAAESAAVARVEALVEGLFARPAAQPAEARA
jgi:UDP-N-acetylglucosamine transferase subunit ALG13